MLSKKYIMVINKKRALVQIISEPVNLPGVLHCPVLRIIYDAYVHGARFSPTTFQSSVLKFFISLTLHHAYQLTHYFRRLSFPHASFLICVDTHFPPVKRHDRHLRICLWILPLSMPDYSIHILSFVCYRMVCHFDLFDAFEERTNDRKGPLIIVLYGIGCRVYSLLIVGVLRFCVHD
jgi:hypothetical protein